MAGQVVRIVNRGDSDFNDAYGSQSYSIPAGGELFVDYDAMALWLGHPEATNFDPRNRVRVAEYSRLRVRYGVEARSLEMSSAGLPVDNDELFNSMRPKLECFDVAGKPILTVADDPEGTFLTGPSDTASMDSDALIHARMAQLEQEISNLRTQQATNARREQSLNEAVPTPYDDMDPEDRPLAVGGAGIPGTIPTVIDPDADPASSTAPRSAPRTTPGEDSPTRVRVSQG